MMCLIAQSDLLVFCFTPVVFHLISGSGVEPPSFDLGVDASPAAVGQETPNELIFAIQPMLSPEQKGFASAASTLPSLGLADMSPTDATRQLAQCIILDIVHVIEEGIDPAGKVLYGQWITEPFNKVHALVEPPPCISWSLVHRHPIHDLKFLGHLIDCCKELVDHVIRRYVGPHVSFIKCTE